MKLKNTVSSASFFFVLLYVFVVHCSNENSKKAIWKTSETNTARASRLFVHFIVCLRARIFIILRFTQVNKGQRFYSSFPKLRYILFEFISRKIRQRLTNWLRWNWSDEVWNSSNSLFDCAREHLHINNNIHIRSWHLIMIFTYRIQEINQLTAK